MVKGGETLGNEESSSEETGEEEEVIPTMYRTPGVRPLTPGVGIPVFLSYLLKSQFRGQRADSAWLGKSSL